LPPPLDPELELELVEPPLLEDVEEEDVDECPDVPDAEPPDDDVEEEEEEVESSPQNVFFE
jgi:hypothetical protein